MSYKNYFSKQADDYARYRPRYPDALFAALADLSAEHSLAWDCATGNGQVALGLTPYFERIYATDASGAQIARAFLNDKITYSVAPAECTTFRKSTIDLITVGQALHWFDLEKFYREVERVLKPGGVLAVWCYGSYKIDVSEKVRTILQDFNTEIEHFWPPEVRLVEARYETIPFPFTELSLLSFSLEATWSVEVLLGYLRSWSATQLQIAEQGEAYFQDFASRLTVAWETGASKAIHWPIYVRVGRTPLAG